MNYDPLEDDLSGDPLDDDLLNLDSDPSFDSSSQDEGDDFSFDDDDFSDHDVDAMAGEYPGWVSALGYVFGGAAIFFAGVFVWGLIFPAHHMFLVGKDVANLTIGDPVYFLGQEIGTTKSVQFKNNTQFATIHIHKPHEVKLPSNVQFSVTNNGILQGKRVELNIDESRPSAHDLPRGSEIHQKESQTTVGSLLEMAEGVVNIQTIIMVLVLVLVAVIFVKAMIRNMIGIGVFILVAAGIVFLLFKSMS